MSDEPTTSEEATTEETADTGLVIDDATPDTSVGGGELIPVSDAGAPKVVTTGQIKDYTIAQIVAAAAASGVSLDNDKVYLLQGGALKPLTAADLGAAIMNAAFGRTAVAEITGNEVFAVKDANDRKTITVEALAAWLEDNLEIDADLDISALSAASVPLADTDLLVVARGSTNGKLSIADFSAWCLARFAAYVTALTAANSVTTSDVVYILQSGTAKKATVAQLIAAVGAGNVVGPNSTTEGKVPQWDNVTRKLKDGVPITTEIAASPEGTKIPTEGAVRTAIDAMGDTKAPTTTTSGKVPVWSSTSKKLDDGKTVQTTVRAAANASDDAIPTEKAVRTALDANGGVAGPSLTTEDYVPQWDSANKTLKNGKSVQESVRNTANASHGAIPTEKAVRDALDGLVATPPSHTEDAIPVWGAGSELKAGKSVTTVIASTGSDDKIPTEKAVRDALPVAATTAAAGLMSAADKTKLDNLVDTSSVAEIGGALADNDTIVVKQLDSVNKKSLLSRFWTYIMGKLPTYKIDDLAQGDDNTDLDANSARHGLCPKLPTDDAASKFLRGDGTFATPTGSAPFVGTDGEEDGTQGLVPAPVVGDEVKFLCGNGAWATPPSAAGVDIPGATAIDALADADLAYFYDASANGYRKVSAAQIRALVMGTVRYDTIFVPAGAMTPSNTDGATPGAVSFNGATHDTMAFPSTADKTAEFSVAFPGDWDKGAVKVKYLWTFYDSTAGQSGEAVRFSVGAVSCADGDDISDTPTVMLDVDDLTQSANELCKSGASAGLTPEGTLDGGNLVHFTVKRDTQNIPSGATPLPTEAMLLGMIIQFGRTADYTGW